MSSDHRRRATLAARALAWTRRPLELACDRTEPWEHGIVYRASRCPAYFDLNVVRVTDDPGIGVEALIAFADVALAGLGHRRIDFDSAQAAESLRAEFAARGFQSTRLVWMHFDGSPHGDADVAVTEVPYDAVNGLRIAWHQEDLPRLDPAEFLAQARETRLALGTRVLAVHDQSHPVAFATLDLGDDETEIAEVYVLPRYRGHGRGTALTRAAITAAGNVADLWICADDEDRPKQLYARLGFRPVLTTMQFLSA